jgi:prepilin-type N-terminal cleavage/methylation domain-containing protein
MKKSKGFTLIEIIVVIVILAVLMAIAVPGVLKYVDSANNTKSLANARAFYNAIQTVVIKEYAEDNAYSANSSVKITYEAITNSEKVSSPDTTNTSKARICKVYDYMGNISNKYAAIALIDQGVITLMRYKDLDTQKIFEWTPDTQTWTEMTENKSTWTKIFVDEAIGKKEGVWWNGRKPLSTEL